MCFVVTYGLVGLPLIISLVIVGGIMTCFKRMCCCCNSKSGDESREYTICDELLNRYSY